MLPAVFGENLFDDFFDDAFLAPVFHTRNPLYGKNAAHIMKTDIREKDGSYELDVDLPGFKKDEVQLNLENGYLTISAEKSLNRDEKEEGKEKDEGRYLRRERYAGRCSRSFYVGDALQPSDISSSFEDGILRISMPKAAPKQLPAKTTVEIK